MDPKNNINNLPYIEIKVCFRSQQYCFSLMTFRGILALTIVTLIKILIYLVARNSP